MFWIILIILIIAVVVYRFLTAINEDHKEMQEMSLDKRYSKLIQTLDTLFFVGKGKLQRIDERTYRLFEENSNTSIDFFYSTGHLTIVWKKKTYLSGNFHFEKKLDYVRNLDYTSQVAQAEVFHKDAEYHFKKKGIPGIISSKFLYSSEEEKKNYIRII